MLANLKKIPYIINLETNCDVITMNLVKQYKFISELMKKPYIEAIYLYGSRARGDHQERSDIDLAIVCSTATSTQWAEVLDIIDDADTLLKVDCVRYDRLTNIPLKRNIDRDRQVIYESKK